MPCCTLRKALLVVLSLAMVALLERTVFDFLGYMWSPILADILCWMFLVVCIFGAAQRRSACLIAYIPWAVVWLAWNALIICIYVGFGTLTVTPVLDMNTGSVSWWVHGIGCQYNLTAAGQVDASSVTGCALPYAYVEVLQAAVQLLFGLLTLVLSAVYAQRVIREENDLKVVREAEMQYIHMREEQSGAGTPQSARHTSRPGPRANADTQTLTTQTGTGSSNRQPSGAMNGAQSFPYADPAARANANANALLQHTPTLPTAAPVFPNAAARFGDPLTTGPPRPIAPTAASVPPMHAETGRRPHSSERPPVNPNAAYLVAQQDDNVPMRRDRSRQSGSSGRSKRSAASAARRKQKRGAANAQPLPSATREFGTTETVLQPSDDASSDDNEREPVRSYATSSFKRRQNDDNNRNSADSRSLRDALTQIKTAPPVKLQSNQPFAATPAYSQPQKLANRNPDFSQPGPPRPDSNFLTHSHPRQQNVPRHPIPSIFAGQSPAATANWQPRDTSPPTVPTFSQATPTGLPQSSRSNLNRHTPPHGVVAPQNRFAAPDATSPTSVSMSSAAPSGPAGPFQFGFPARGPADSSDDALPPYQPRNGLPPANRAPVSAANTALSNSNPPNRASFGSQRMLNVNTNLRNNPNSLAQKSPAASTGSVMLIGAPSVV